MLTDLSIKTFLEKTAAGSPTPGGGSVAALIAAAAASLCEMTAGLTIGKRGFESCEAEMKTIAARAHELKERFIFNVDQDAAAYAGVVEAFKMPRETESQQQNRKQTIQDRFKQASEIPLQVAKDALALMDLLLAAVKRGNPNAVSDASVGVLAAGTAVRSALLNVKINLDAITDPSFVTGMLEQVEEIKTEATQKETHALSSSALQI